MSEAYEFLKECGVFFVGTVDEEGNPQMRPFGAVMEHEGKLYISTAEGKRVYRQMKKNPSVQLLALKAGTRNWIRMSGRAFEESSMQIKGLMLEKCPALEKHFPSAETAGYAVFRLEDMRTEEY